MRRYGPLTIFGWYVVFGICAFAAIAITLGVTRDAILIAPLALIATIVLLGAGLHRLGVMMKTDREPDSGARRERDATRGEPLDTLPGWGLDDRTDYGTTPEHALTGSRSHEDMERGPH